MQTLGFYSSWALDRYLWWGQPDRSPLFRRRSRWIERTLRDRPLQSGTPLAEVDGRNLDRATFLRETDQLRRSVVFRGFAEDTQAVRTWSREHLTERVGGVRCTVWRNLGEWTDTWDDESPLSSMTFGEFFERMQYEPLYLNNSVDLVQADPTVLDELGLPELRQRVFDRGAGDEPSTTQVFIGSDRVGSPLHAAMGGNLFVQLVGRKRWTFIAPEHSPWVHPVPARPFQFATSGHGAVRAHPAAPDAAVRAPFDRIPRQQVVLEPGDLLFNACWWWHEVDNLDPFTVGMALRYNLRPGRVTPDWHNHPLFAATSVFPLLRAVSWAHAGHAWATGADRPLHERFNSLVQRNLDRLHRGND